MGGSRGSGMVVSWPTIPRSILLRSYVQGWSLSLQVVQDNYLPVQNAHPAHSQISPRAKGGKVAHLCQTFPMGCPNTMPRTTAAPATTDLTRLSSPQSLVSPSHGPATRLPEN